MPQKERTTMKVSSEGSTISIAGNMALAIFPPSINRLPNNTNTQQIFFDLHSFEIRLVRLLPGAWDDDIKCELYQVPLANKPTYKALSYVWGSAKVVRPIILNGIQHCVTINLESALRRLRRSSDILTLWVDALCINQSNFIERANQVGLMREIFSNTEEVLVYLGEVASYHVNDSERSTKTPNPEIIFFYDNRDQSMLDGFQERCKSKSPKRVGTAADIGFELDVFCLIRSLAANPSLESIPPFDEQSRSKIPSHYQEGLFEGLRQLMRSRWWNRVWIIQEIVVPKQVRVIYGSLVAPWQMLAAAATNYSRNLYSSLISAYPREFTKVLSLFARMIGDIANLRDRWRSGTRQDLLPLLRQFGGREATDDRDRVYALLGLQKGIKMVADYTLDTPAVFVKTAREIVMSTQSLELLMGDRGRKTRPGLPSWVPDWTALYDDIDRRRAENANLYRLAKRSTDYEDDKFIMSVNAILSRLATGFNIYNRFFGAQSEEGRFELSRNFFEAPTLTYDATEDVTVVHGISIGCVSRVGKVNISSEELTSTIQSWFKEATSLFYSFHPSQALGASSLQNRYGTEKEFGHVFQRTLCGDIILSSSDRHAANFRRIAVEDQTFLEAWLFGLPNTPLGEINIEMDEALPRLRDLFFDIFDPTSVVSMGQIASVDASVKLATYRRRLFVTSSGYIGLGPSSMLPEDKIFLLHGSKTPIVLHPVDHMRYALVGDCYLHGAMDDDAEALLASSELNWPSVSTKLKELQALEIELAPSTSQGPEGKLPQETINRLERAAMILTHEVRTKVECQLI